MMGADARNWPAAPKKTPHVEKFFIAQIYKSKKSSHAQKKNQSSLLVNMQSCRFFAFGAASGAFMNHVHTCT